MTLLIARLRLAADDVAMKRLTITDMAIKQMARLPIAEQKALREKLKRYTATGAGNVTRLAGRDEFRLRQGDYRAIFRETADQIEVVAIGHRREIYR